MPAVHVPVEQRPFVWKYVAGTVFGFLVIGALVWFVSRGVDGVVLEAGVVMFGLVAQVTVVFLMVQSLVEAWMEALEVVPE